MLGQHQCRYLGKLPKGEIPHPTAKTYQPRPWSNIMSRMTAYRFNLLCSALSLFESIEQYSPFCISYFATVIDRTQSSSPSYQRNSSIPRPVLISKPFLPQRPHSWRGRVMSALYSPMPKILVAYLPRDLQMPSDGWFFFEIVDIIAVGLYLSILEPSPLMESSR